MIRFIHSGDLHLGKRFGGFSGDLPSRLREARHRMRTQDIDVAEAGYAVGYSDASHFNREYKSLFGVPPVRDIQRLREEALQIATIGNA